MSTPSLRWKMSCVVSSALTLFVLCARTLVADAVHDGKWSVTSAVANHGIHVNNTGATQKAMVTVCTVAGGSVNVLWGAAPVAVVTVGECSTRADTLTNTSSVGVQLASGPSANGTYSVRVLP